jgi:hypothetical protein
LVRPLAIDVAYANVTAVGVDDVADVVGAHFERELDLQPIELGEEIRASVGGGKLPSLNEIYSGRDRPRSPANAPPSTFLIFHSLLHSCLARGNTRGILTALMDATPALVVLFHPRARGATEQVLASQLQFVAPVSPKMLFSALFSAFENLHKLLVCLAPRAGLVVARTVAPQEKAEIPGV